MAHEVRLSRPARKQLDAIPRADYLRLHEAIRGLSDAPRTDGCVKLGDDLYRIRSGAYRIVYAVLDAERTVLVVKVARRSEKTYRGLA